MATMVASHDLDLNRGVLPQLPYKTPSQKVTNPLGRRI